MENIVQLSTTTEARGDAEKLAELLLQRRLVACAQISGPISSHYRWQGELRQSEEFTLRVKTTEKLAETVMEAIVNNHPYQLPEVVGKVITLSSGAYREWVADQLEQSENDS
jgi:periplasmic divalent cation tolerance protein